MLFFYASWVNVEEYIGLIRFKIIRINSATNATSRVFYISFSPKWLNNSWHTITHFKAFLMWSFWDFFLTINRCNRCCRCRRWFTITLNLILHLWSSTGHISILIILTRLFRKSRICWTIKSIATENEKNIHFGYVFWWK